MCVCVMGGWVGGVWGLEEEEGEGWVGVWVGVVVVVELVVRTISARASHQA